MRTKPLSVTVAALAVLTASACGATSTDAGSRCRRHDGKAVSGLRMMVPNSPGGGYDVTARTGAKVMEDAEDRDRRRGLQPLGRRRHGGPGQARSTRRATATSA